VSTKGRRGVEMRMRQYVLVAVGDGKVFVDTYDRFGQHGDGIILPIKRVRT